MRYGITHYSKTIRHVFFSSFLIILIGVSNSTLATKAASIRLLSKLAVVREVRGETERGTAVYTSVHEDSSTVSQTQLSTAVGFRRKSISVNVYLKLQPSNPIMELVKRFNAFLDTNQILQQYHITPFLDHHPLHLTLYLARYHQNQLPKIIQRVAIIAKHSKALNLQTEKIEATPSMYTLLLIKKNTHLQKLSNRAVIRLMGLRDRYAAIPAWARNDPKRKKAFLRFGSPTVFEHFSPHFSLFKADGSSEEQNHHLQAVLEGLIAQFSKQESLEVNTKATIIAVGLADTQGQIVKEVASFPLE